MIGLNVKEWDSDVLGLVDENEYSKDVKSTLQEQELNIELENKPHPASKSTMAQVESKGNTTGPTLNEKLGKEYKDNNHKGKSVSRTNLDVMEMQKKLQEEKRTQKENKIKLAKIQKEKEATLKKLAEIKEQKE